jgi:hypothetical protein
VKLEKRYPKEIPVLASYAYSKSMDNSSGNLIGGEAWSTSAVQDWNNLKSEWSTSVLDQTHRFVAGAMYALPSGQRRKGAWMLPRRMGDRRYRLYVHGRGAGHQRFCS